jgi:hypothetical protein
MAVRVYKLKGGSVSSSTTITPEDTAVLDREFHNVKSNRNNEDLTENTKKSYISKLQKIAILTTGHPYKDYKFLLNYKEVIDVINKHINKSSKDYVASIVKLLKTKENVPQKVIQEYTELMKTNKTTEDQTRGNNIVSEVHKERLNGLTLETIKQRITNYKPESDLEYVYQLICAFYFLNGFTPRNDLYTFKIKSATNKKPYNPEYNYITVNGVMLNYKTKTTYGKQDFIISPELEHYLTQYLKLYGKQAGDFLFVDKNGVEFKSGNFNNVIHNSMKNVIGSDLNIDLIRQYKLTNIYNQNPNMTINERTELARNYLHSATTGLEYSRPGMLKDDNKPIILY